METRRRSFLKALSWRLFATIITTTVAYTMTGKMSFAVEIGAIDTLIKIFIYFAHERFWQLIPYGKIRPTDYQI
jgi:uncharacterized membrane protein